MDNLFDVDWNEPFEVANQAAQKIREATGVEKHDIALTLGSGWAKAADLIGETVATVDASTIPGFSKSAVVGHVSTIRSIRLHSGKYALVLGARTHLYENKGVEKVVHGVRTAKACGVEIMVLTNGAGGIPTEWAPGSPIIIRDHINLTGTSPLNGATFIDMSSAYSERLRKIAKEADSSLNEGVYVQFRGPQYETPAEVQMAAKLGGDLVGMSTALETIAAREQGMEVFGLSLMTNQAAGIQKTPLSHKEVLEAGQAAESRISKLLAEIVGRL